MGPAHTLMDPAPTATVRHAPAAARPSAAQAAAAKRAIEQPGQ